ncbi:MAG: YggS family pyridoxal phosphate-dependent enzyme [Prevotellaceae bacterium]|jgi:pyridoxal phosphate enzyme (YggS family)|nr:YggS family pyridoxal phosphate-dependent enzyme [Prevotellaceae bacterium]
MSIKSNLQHIKATIPANVKLVCVSKFHSSENILEAYAAGERIFGESRVQELVKKHESLPQDIQWHFIGHLQTNKVKFIVPFVNLIHAVDSEKLLVEINKEAAKIGKTVNCLLEVHIAQEADKYGFSPAALMEFLFAGQWAAMRNVRICGLMGIATFTDDMTQIRHEMQLLKQIFDRAHTDFFDGNDRFTELSMGMSDDYPIAIEEGTTIVRIGTSIFGTRN